MSLGIYIHIPFCKSKCKYCDFNSSSDYFHLEDDYTKRLIEEINSSEYKGRADTVFIGGGTPTAIKHDNLMKIVNALNDNFDITDSEFTVECNPATVEYTRLCDMKKHGINRLSIGLQSANDDELKFLGRIHTFDMFVNTYADAVRAGFDNINVDLMFSLHNQNIDSWGKSLKNVIKLKPQHISCYSLIVEEGTPFYNMELNLPDEEQDREMYYYAIDTLGRNNYNQYEISNFSFKGYECLHNIKYWTRENYVGFGCSAAGMYNDVRMQNSYNICDYINNNKVKKDELSKKEAKVEHIFLGLRMTDGFDISEYNNKYGRDFKRDYKDIINKYTSIGLLEIANGRCRLTKNGLSVSNSIMCEFL